MRRSLSSSLSLLLSSVTLGLLVEFPELGVVTVVLLCGVPSEDGTIFGSVLWPCGLVSEAEAGVIFVVVDGVGVCVAEDWVLVVGGFSEKAKRRFVHANHMLGNMIC